MSQDNETPVSETPKKRGRQRRFTAVALEETSLDTPEDLDDFTLDTSVQELSEPTQEEVKPTSKEVIGGLGIDLVAAVQEKRDAQENASKVAPEVSDTVAETKAEVAPVDDLEDDLEDDFVAETIVNERAAVKDTPEAEPTASSIPQVSPTPRKDDLSLEDEAVHSNQEVVHSNQEVVHSNQEEAHSNQEEVHSTSSPVTVEEDIAISKRAQTAMNRAMKANDNTSALARLAKFSYAKLTYAANLAIRPLGRAPGLMVALLASPPMKFAGKSGAVLGAAVTAAYFIGATFTIDQDGKGGALAVDLDQAQPRFEQALQAGEDMMDYAANSITEFADQATQVIAGNNASAIDNDLISAEDVKNAYMKLTIEKLGELGLSEDAKEDLAARIVADKLGI